MVFDISNSSLPDNGKPGQGDLGQGLLPSIYGGSMKLTRLLVLLFLVSCATRYDKNKTYKLTVLHTNDHHGRFWANRDGEWGLAARSTLINEIRREVKLQGGQSLLIDAGDINTGVPQSDMLDAEPDFLGMAKLGYDAMAVGNHEFDNELSVIRQQERWAGFPFLSANTYDSKTNQRLFRPFIIEDIDGLKIAIIGLTTLDTAVKSKYGSAPGIEFRDPVKEASQLVPELRKQSNIVIALTHMGHYPNENHGADAPGDVTLARQVNGLDIIVGGHTQLPLFKPDVQNGALILQAHEWGKYVGRLDLEFKDGKMKMVNYQLIPINHKGTGPRISEDEGMINLLRPFKERGDKSLLVKVSETEEKLIGDRDIVRSRETNLGNLVAEAYRSKFNADLGISNSGGIRDSIPAGEITYESVLMVLPFSNDIVTVQMTGGELKQYLSGVLDQGTVGSGAFPQFAGLTAHYSRKSKTFSKLVIANKPLNPKQQYLIALPAFLATGGDKYPILSKANVKNYGYMDADVFREYLQAQKVIRQGSHGPFGRVVIRD